MSNVTRSFLLYMLFSLCLLWWWRCQILLFFVTHEVDLLIEFEGFLNCLPPRTFKHCSITCGKVYPWEIHNVILASVPQKLRVTQRTLCYLPDILSYFVWNYLSDSYFLIWFLSVFHLSPFWSSAFVSVSTYLSFHLSARGKTLNLCLSFHLPEPVSIFFFNILHRWHL